MAQADLFGGFLAARKGAKKGERRAGMYVRVEKKATRAEANEAFDTLNGIMSDRLDKLILDAKALQVRYRLGDGQITLLLQDLQALFFPALYADGGTDLFGGEVPHAADDGLVPRPECLGVGDDRMVVAADEWGDEGEEEEAERRFRAHLAMQARISKRGGTMAGDLE